MRRAFGFGPWFWPRGQGGSGWPDAVSSSRSSWSRQSCTRSRSPGPFLPAQDGLKFIHVARQFQKDSWPDVVRDTDQHPLYPALVAVVEPAVAVFRGTGPETWRIAAQVVAALASLALLFPLYGLARSLFDTRIACMAVAIYALLPVPAEVGHDTLSDSLGLLAILLSLRWGALAVRTGRWQSALAAGLAGGIGYLARPEAILAPAAVGLAWVFTWSRRLNVRSLIASLHRRSWASLRSCWWAAMRS